MKYITKDCAICKAIKAIELYEKQKNQIISISYNVPCAVCKGTGKVQVESRSWITQTRKTMNGLEWMQDEHRLCPLEPETKYDAEWNVSFYGYE